MYEQIVQDLQKRHAVETTEESEGALKTATEDVRM
jgi:hypothetical protein